MTLDADDLASVLALKQRYDGLLTEHTALQAALTQRDSAAALSTQRRAAKDADWHQRLREAHGDLQRATRELADETERRVQGEAREEHMRAEAREREEQWDARQRLLDLAQSDLSHERSMADLLRTQLQRLNGQCDADRADREAALDGRHQCPGRDAQSGVLLQVENAVLSRRVQRLELELTTCRADADERAVVETRHAQVIHDIQQHVEQLTSTSMQHKKRPSEEDGGREEALAELEVALLREQLACERVAYWRKERRLYVAALLWLLALLAVSLASLALV